MATAVETSPRSQAPSPPASLLTASLIGAIYVLAALAVVLYAVPSLWEQLVGDSLSGNRLLEGALKLTLEIAAIVGLVWFGTSLAGSNPPKGLRELRGAPARTARQRRRAPLPRCACTRTALRAERG